MVNNGIPKDLIDASLHQLEIKLKKISGGFPYGLQLLMSSMPYILHNADILHNDIEVYESLVLNGIITGESLRLMDRISMPKKECNIVKIIILIASEFVICMIVC